MPVIETKGDARRRADAELIEQLEKRFSPRGIRWRRFHRSRKAFWLLWVNVLEGAKRFLDFAAATVLLLTVAPLLLLLYVLVRVKGGMLVRSPRLGRWGCVFEELSFSSGFARHLPSLINVWRGDMSLIGPRAVAPGEVSAAERLGWKRFNTRPGLLCLWWIRSRSNIAYGTEVGSDLEYVDSQSFAGDLGIALRAIPASFYGEGVAEAPDQVDLLGITIDNLTMDEAIEDILARARAAAPSQLCFVNADCANIAWNNPLYRRVLANSDVVVADGIGMKLAGRMLNRNIRQNVNGTDMFPRLCGILEQEGVGLYLLGGKPGVAEDVRGWIQQEFPGLAVRGSRHGYFSAQEVGEVIEDIRQSGAELLLVAFGAPKQEQWISDHLHETTAKLAMGVGGLFDFYSGRIPRAPQWVREVGMEWLFRFWQEPRRMWKRYFVGNGVFLLRVMRERFGSGGPL